MCFIVLVFDECCAYLMEVVLVCGKLFDGSCILIKRKVLFS